MTNRTRQTPHRYSLRTLGRVALLHRESAVTGLRKKDLALLAYLAERGPGAYSRVVLSSLLWGDRPQARARHSLTQAVGRLRGVLGDEALGASVEQIEWRARIDCDLQTLERAHERASGRAADIGYAGDFLSGFHPGPGAEEFEEWAEQKRTHYRRLALRTLESWGADAEGRADWTAALELGRKAVEIETLYEEGHRRVMRSWARLGDRGLALRHYGEFVLWLSEHLDIAPDPATTRLAMQLRDEGKAGGQPVEGGSTAGVVESRGTRDRRPATVDDAGGIRRLWARLMRGVRTLTTD